MLARRWFLALPFVSLALLGASPVTARAAPPPASDFEAASKAEQDAVAQVLAVRAKRAALESHVHDLDVRAIAMGDRARRRAAELAIVDQTQRNLAARLGRTQARLELAKSRARHAAAEMYRGAAGSTPPVLGLLSGGRSVHDVSVGERYLSHVGDRITRDVNAVKFARRDVVNAQRNLRSQRREVERAAAVARREQDAVVALRAQQDRALGAVRNEEANENQVLAAARARRAEFERAAETAQSASGTIEEILRARPVSGTAPTHLLFPADGPISSAFGQRVHPIFRTVRLHAGIDIGAAYGAPVHAAAAGIVVVAGTASGYGNAVVIEHGGGVATLSGHLSRLGVKVGQTVAAGQTIGAVGNTGNSTGPHLHFEVRVRGVPVDPMRYL